MEGFDPEQYRRSIFSIKTEGEFNDLALAAFRHQAVANPVYASFIGHLGIAVSDVHRHEMIPFLPIGFFKSKAVVTGNVTPELTFKSSGTTGMQQSHHLVADASLYEESFMQCFTRFFGNPRSWCFIALLPSYMEQGNSSLVYMVDALIRQSSEPGSGFYQPGEKLVRQLHKNAANGTRTMLWGVSYALLDLAETSPGNLGEIVIMETGGMKGRRKEMIREELHAELRNAFEVPAICSEYGMTELLSQAYLMDDGNFHCPPWMRISVRDVYDPFEPVLPGKTGGINVTDLANIHSCCFIETQDLGKIKSPGTFEVAGRFDNSDIRGCNLMAQ